MSTTEFVLGIFLCLFSVAIVLIVLGQEGHQKNMGVLTGGGEDTFYSRNKGRSIDAFLERWTKFTAIVLFLLVIATNAIVFFVK